jgi:hypothetical protein
MGLLFTFFLCEVSQSQLGFRCANTLARSSTSIQVMRACMHVWCCQICSPLCGGVHEASPSATRTYVRPHTRAPNASKVCKEDHSTQRHPEPAVSAATNRMGSCCQLSPQSLTVGVTRSSSSLHVLTRPHVWRQKNVRPACVWRAKSSSTMQRTQNYISKDQLWNRISS